MKPKSKPKPKSRLLPIEDAADFKFWRLRKENASALLNEIIFRWRNTSARLPGKAGKWCCYPIAQWCDWTKLSRDQVERALRELVAQGWLRHLY